MKLGFAAGRVLCRFYAKIDKPVAIPWLRSEQLHFFYDIGVTTRPLLNFGKMAISAHGASSYILGLA